MAKYFSALRSVVILFNLISLLVGYGIPRLVKLDRRQAIAICTEVGLHNGALAIAVALSPLMLNSSTMAAAPSL